ncbi:pirin family protein [Acetobacter fallax]|uniref:Quercetin 2,3-dioxygenase C-terminal cupin domain-containing protein n=1 Tax=Acetobacter fallax TaxID=1737473 RepID=A0ABX0K9K0_9PROT|nr:hypothetical protein [Acetobacter fallax]NHO33100.1 hypothetical protein [Acetobacter fallax]NHO36751.1 hypothetical protein [Acetobacter fallax]
MIAVRRQSSLGEVQDQGVTLRCHFPFRSYVDPMHGCCGRLRVLNTGTLTAGMTYAVGPESGMEILTWLRDGSLSTSVAGFPGDTLSAGGLHAVSTGDGVSRLEWVAGTGEAFFLQFWLLPDDGGGEPSQEVRSEFPALEKGSFRILASGFPEDDPEELAEITDGSPVTIRSRSRLLDAHILAREGARYDTTPGRALYLTVVSGGASVGDAMLAAGDAVAVTGKSSITVLATENTVVLLVDTAS